MKQKLTMTLACLFLLVGSALAQTKVTGVVTSSEDGQPVTGVSVKVVGTTVGALTNLDGVFTITVPNLNSRLQFTYIGMLPKTVKASAQMKVVLEPDSKVLGEVVVTGMQKMDKRLFTGSTSKIDAAKSRLDGVADVSRSLEGRVAGVSVQNVSGTFGTAPKIRVRGATSIYGSSKPLWVVDGVIMEDVTEVNADDIESFQILKDGSATSIYGARAMGGVIVVTTKKGKAGTTRINYTGEFTMRLKPDYGNFNIMNSQEQMGIYKEMEADGLISFGRTYRASDSGVYGKMYHLINTYASSG